jgi:alkylhydroperoxidase family enzyme
VEAVLEDFRRAPITDKEKALFAVIEKIAQDSTTIRRDDLDRARESGWSDEALYDAITVSALFHFYNVWIDATGVHDMPAAAYTMSGERLATGGYVVEQKRETPSEK